MKVKLNYLSLGISALLFMTGVAKAQVPQVNIISRANWGADEIKRYDDGELIWPEEYTGVKKIIIHHTAGTNGMGHPQDTVRAIYDYHAQGREWGDIGYNYLIDPQGNIYEGRAGGDGVVGAHAYDDSRDIGWNQNTIGISILGTYGGWVNEPKQGYYLEHPEYYPVGRVKNERLRGTQWQIYLEDTLTSQAEESLASLIAVKALDFGFNPLGVSEFQGKSLPNVIGHRDVDSTTCPGDGLYNSLSIIRNKAEAKYKEMIASGIKQKATLIGPSDIKVSLKKDETKEIILQFRNDGDLTWHNYTDDKLVLANADVKTKIAALDGLRLAAVNEEKSAPVETPLVASLQEHNVKPGEIGTFKIILSYPKEKIIDEKDLILAMQNKGWFSGTDIKVTAAAIDLSYKGELTSQSLPVAIFENAKGDAIIKIRNTGLKAWYQENKKNGDTGSEIYLKILDKTSGKVSMLHDSSWNDDFGLVKPEEEEVTPGNSATFKLKFQIKNPGFYRTQFILMRKVTELENVPDIEVMGANFDILTRVDSPIQAELIEAKVPSAMLNVWTSKAVFKIKNTGMVPWDSKNFAMKVGNADATFETNPFKDKSWGKSDIAARLPTKVMPGQMAILAVNLKAPKEGGIYHLTFYLEFKGKPVYISHSKELIYAVRVDEVK